MIKPGDSLQLLVFLVAAFIAIILDAEKKEIDNPLQKRMEAASSLLQLVKEHQDGYVVFAADGAQLTQTEMQIRASRKASHWAYYWEGEWVNNDFGRGDFIPGTISEEGTDGRQYFVNSFLLGIHPFSVDNLALPLYAIAQRKIYQLDSRQYGKTEVWQNSAEAFINLRGDCEDHAIVLADWLISEGVDAKVVVGHVPQGGHAWVVATIEGQDYILEATSKRVGLSWRHYPLASLNTDYVPEFMFNRDTFWVNTDKQNITEYTGQHWRKMSTFYRYPESELIRPFPSY